jgi:hypothetical protein
MHHTEEIQAEAAALAASPGDKKKLTWARYGSRLCHLSNSMEVPAGEEAPLGNIGRSGIIRAIWSINAGVKDPWVPFCKTSNNLGGEASDPRSQ